MGKKRICVGLVMVIIGVAVHMARPIEASPARQTGTPTLIMASDQYIVAAEWSPDGRWILTLTSDDTAHIWDSQTGTMVASLPHAGFLVLPQWSPDGTRVVTWVGQNVWIWEAGTWGALHELQHPQPVSSADWRPDGQQLAVLTFMDEQGGQYYLWDANTGVQQLVFNTLHSVKWTGGFSWSPDGRYLISTGFDDTAVLQLWDNTGEEVVAMQQPSSSYSILDLPSATWSLDGTQLLIDDVQGGAVMYDAGSWTPHYEFKDDMYLTRVEWSPDQRWIVGVAAGSRRMPVWNGQTGDFVYFMTDEWFFGGAEWSRSSQHFLTYMSNAGGQGRAAIWDIDSGTVLQSLTFSTTGVGVNWSRDETLIFVDNNAVEIYRMADGALVLKIQADSIRWHPINNRLLAWVNAEDDCEVDCRYEVQVWDVQ